MMGLSAEGSMIQQSTIDRRLPPTSVTRNRRPNASQGWTRQNFERRLHQASLGSRHRLKPFRLDAILKVTFKYIIYPRLWLGWGDRAESLVVQQHHTGSRIYFSKTSQWTWISAYGNNNITDRSSCQAESSLHSVMVEHKPVVLVHKEGQSMLPQAGFTRPPIGSRNRTRPYKQHFV